MARYSSSFGDKLQIKVGIGKEYGFTSIFDMPKSFARRKTELAHKKVRAKNFTPFLSPSHKALRDSIAPQMVANNSQTTILLNSFFCSKSVE